MDTFSDYPVYYGKDLGVTYTPGETVFKVWAPKASEVLLRLYESGQDGEPVEISGMKLAPGGVWAASVKREVKNLYYTFQVQQEGRWLLERPDIYARAVGVNGLRGMVLNMDTTNPKEWGTDTKPPLDSFTDIIIYELHVRDLSIASNSGITHKGKFLGVAETGTKSPEGVCTGLDHIKELGVTHVH